MYYNYLFISFFVILVFFNFSNATIPIQINNNGGGGYATSSSGCNSIKFEFWFNDTIGTEVRQIQSNIASSQAQYQQFGNGISYMSVLFNFQINAITILQLNISNTIAPIAFDTLPPMTYECLTPPSTVSTLSTNIFLRDPNTLASGTLPVQILHKYSPQPFTCVTNNPTVYTCTVTPISKVDNINFNNFIITLTFVLKKSSSYTNALVLTITNSVGTSTTLNSKTFVPSTVDGSLTTLGIYPDAGLSYVECTKTTPDKPGCTALYLAKITNPKSFIAQYLPEGTIPLNAKPLIRAVTHSGTSLTYAVGTFVTQSTNSQFGWFDGDGFTSQVISNPFEVASYSYSKFTNPNLTIVKTNPKAIFWNFKGNATMSFLFNGFRFFESNQVFYYTSYPFGITSSFKQSTSFSMSKIISPYQSSAVNLNATLYSQCQQSLSATPTPTISDTNPPNLISVEYETFSSYSIIVKVKATDDLSGVYRILIGDKNQIDIRQYDIVWGTKLNGVFEKIVTFKELNFLVNTVTIFDAAGNSKTFQNSNTVLPSYNAFQSLPQPKISIYPSQITYFSFSPNNIDTTLQFTSGTLKFNVSNADTAFTPILELFSSNLDQNFINRYTFNGSYSSTDDMYVIQFNLPMKMIPTSVDYNLYMRPFTWTPRILSAYIGGNAFLNVTSTKSDEYGPYVTTLIQDKTSYTFGANVTPVIAWRASITTIGGSFSSGILKVISNVDPQSYELYFDQSNMASPGVYLIKLTLEPNCFAQTFDVTDLILVDANGYRTQYNTTYLIDSLRRDSNRVDGSYEIPITCTKPTGNDNNQPNLVSFDFNPKEIDVGSMNRSVYFEFQVKDISSGPSKIHTPSIYLTSTNDEILKYTVNLVSINSTDAIYNLNVTLPFGFGIGGTLVSLYGISDVQLNFLGLSGSDLYDRGLPFFLNTTLNSTAPVLEKASNVSVFGGPLTVYGKRFGASVSELEAYIHYYDEKPFVRIPTTFFSGTVLAFNTSELPKGAILYVRVRGVESNHLYINSDQPYVPPPYVPPDCSGVKNCSGRGNCTSNNICSCIAPWGTADCSKEIKPVDPPVLNPNDPTTIILGGKISILRVRELNQVQEVVKEYNLTAEWDYENLTTEGSPTLASQYTTTLPNTNTNITTTVQWFTEQTNVTFAGKTLSMSPFTLKYSIYLSPYAFDSQLNSLQVIMAAELSTTDLNSCSSKESSGLGGDSDINFIKLQLNGQTMYMRFLTLADTDGRATSITNTILDGSPNKTKESTKSDALIGINVPYYDIYTLIDPDFSMLIDSQKDSDSTCSSKNKGLAKNALIAIIVCAAAFGVALVAMVIYSIKRHYMRAELKNKIGRTSTKLSVVNSGSSSTSTPGGDAHH